MRLNPFSILSRDPHFKIENGPLRHDAYNGLRYSELLKEFSSHAKSHSNHIWCKNREEGENFWLKYTVGGIWKPFENELTDAQDENPFASLEEDGHGSDFLWTVFHSGDCSNAGDRWRLKLRPGGTTVLSTWEGGLLHPTLVDEWRNPFPTC